MKRSLMGLAASLALCSLLAACDKCGGWEELRTPQPPKFCGGAQNAEK